MCSPSGLFVRTGKLARNEPMSSAKKDAILSTKGGASDSGFDCILCQNVVLVS